MRLTKLVSACCICLGFAATLSSCRNKEVKERIVPDYASAEVFESALEQGEDTIGKTVCFLVVEIKPNSAFGFNIWSGAHLNFISEKNPGAKVGDDMTVKVTQVKNFIGSWMINYDLIYIN